MNEQMWLNFLSERYYSLKLLSDFNTSPEGIFVFSFIFQKDLHLQIAPPHTGPLTYRFSVTGRVLSLGSTLLCKER